MFSKGEGKRMWVMFTILGLVCLGGISSSWGDSDSIFKAYDFPSHPNLTYLCEQRVYPSAPGPHITWAAFASESSPSAVVEYYLQKLGDAGFIKQEDGGIWRFEKGSGQINRVLHIMPVGAGSPHRQCVEKPPSDSRSIILISRRD
jgi:hypothetical protein